jgi:hypothetical protein
MPLTRISVIPNFIIPHKQARVKENMRVYDEICDDVGHAHARQMEVNKKARVGKTPAYK